MPDNRNSETDPVVSGNTAAAPRRRPAAKTRAKRAAKPAEIPAVEVVVARAVGEPSPEEIARLAFSFWEARGCQGGSSDEDWLRAEQQLRARAFVATA